ncbi:integrase [Pseudomonas taiwanensis SJ9]|uniref:Integrase n=2 Tax=Pseudomonas TaxID=286 RepID=V7D317_9PSED|nr:integrase [Pseudomonas taiwanensis SJ9]
MISMEMLGKIRRMYFRDKLSLHQIAKRTGLSRNTIRKWVRAPEATQPAYQRCATFNKLSPFHETLEQALKADSFRAKHNRRSAKALFEQIKADGYDGGYSQLTAFMPTAFDGYVERTVRVSSTCLISVARNRYSVPCERVGQWVSSRLYPTRVVVIADETMIASHERLFDRDQVSFDWQHYIPLIERKPGALRNGAPFADLPKPLQQLKRGLRRHGNGDRVMTQVLAAVPIAGLDAVLVAVELVLESGSLSADHILNVLARLTSTAPPPSAETSLQLKIAPVANTARYDRLRTTDEETRNA